MTGTTVNSAALEMSPAVMTVANSKKTAVKMQDFGNVLKDTLQKQEQPQEPESTVAKDYERAKVTDGPKADEPTQKTTDKEMATEEQAVEAEEKPVDEAKFDEMTVEEIADALTQIIEQIKEILGVSDEELLSGMEDIGLKPFDLLEPANLTQLVTTLSGEDSAISLVANEELYTALQEITQMVETKTGELLENAGLTQDELDMVLTKLQELENAALTSAGDVPEEQNAGEVELFIQDDNAAVEETDDGTTVLKRIENQVEIQAVAAEDVQEDKKDLPKQILSEDGRSEEMTESDTRIQPQEVKQDDGDEHAPKDFGQDKNTPQNFQNNFSEAVHETGEQVESFTPANTESIMRQIADLVKLVKNENLTQMELQLHPASLGTVNVSLTTKGGVVTAEFTTQNETVKAAIEAQASQLQTKLEEQGVRIEAIEVSVESHQMERNLDQNNQGKQQSPQEQQSGRVQGMRRNSIHLKAFENSDALMEEMNGADDGTRIAMEMMVANGNTMDLLA